MRLSRRRGNFNPITGQPTDARKYIRSDIYAGFIQDDFKVRPNLTINLGLRWEYFGPISEKDGNISNPIFGPPGAELSGLVLRTGGNLYNSSKNNWGPQVGFAWSPGKLPLVNQDMHSRLVIRGGGGIGYNRMEEAITLNGRSNPPFVSGLSAFGIQHSLRGAGRPPSVRQLAVESSGDSDVRSDNKPAG